LLIQVIHQNRVVVDVPDLAAAKPKERIRVLHVDDDPCIREISKEVLIDMDSSFEIDQACCVDEAFKKLSTGRYDVVVSDYEMPQKTGLQFLTELREQKNNIPFILFTGKGREEVAIKALNLGADGYHNKQGSPETVYGELAYGIRASFGRKNAEKLLKSSQEALKAIVLNAPLGIATSNSKMLFLSANEAFCRITGYSEDELQKRTFRDITYPEDVEASSAYMEELVSGRISFWSKEKRYVRKDGSIIYGKATVSTIRDCEGKPVLFIAELEDITDRKQAEAELRRTFEVLERVGEGIDAGLAVIGKDYRVVWANKRLMALGVAPNKKCYQTFNRSETICVDCGAKKIFEQNASIDVHEYETVNLKGETTWIELRVTPLKDKNGNVMAALELAVPITERKKTEQILKTSEAKYRKLFDESLDAIFVADVVTGIIVDCNAAASKLVGWQKFELVGQHQSIITLSDQIEDRFARGFKRHLKDPTKTLETRIMTRTGEIRFVSVKATILELNGKKLMQGTFRDITDLKKNENALRESEEKYRLLVNNAQEGILALDNDLTVVFVNPHMEEIVGYTETEIVGKSLFCFIPERGFAHAMHYLQYCREGVDGQFEFELLSKNGEAIFAQVSSSNIKDDEGKSLGILALVSDITLRKKMEESLRQEYESLDKVTQNIGAGLVLISKDYRILWANNYLKQLNGFIENKTCYKTFNTSENICPGCGVLKVFNGASSDTREYLNRDLFEKGLPCWFEIIATPVKDSDGKIVAALELTVDITQKKQMQDKLHEYSHNLEKIVAEKTEQLRQTQVKLLQSERLAAIGELAGMVGHDLRNPLAGMKNAVYYLKKKDSAISEVKGKEMLELIGKAIDHSDKIINDLLDYSREMHFELTKYTAVSLVDNAIGMIQVPDRIKIANQVQEEVWIWVDADKITRVFVNLIKNAIDAMPEKGTLKITSCKRRNRVEIAFADTGTGISEATLQKLFTPLFTTKAQGMGFGLAICKRLIEAHGGSITVKTAENKGTTFTIALPTKPEAGSY
jgi:PAS domain S-box-containing protein